MLAPSPSLQDRPLHGLWSLWDMQEIKAKPFVNAVRALAIIEDLLERRNREELEAKTGPATSKIVTSSLREFTAACVALGADVSKAAADELIEKLAGQELSYAVLHEEVRHLHKYFERQLTSAKLFSNTAGGAGGQLKTSVSLRLRRGRRYLRMTYAPGRWAKR